MDINELKKHKFIVIGYEHYNPLGVIRSLGENNIKPYLIVLKQDIRVASYSKYIKKIYFSESNEDSLSILISEFSNEEYKPFVIPCDDNITELVDKNFDVLKNKFYISNAGSANRITKYMNKYEICQLAEKHGINYAKTWKVINGSIPKDIVYPIITKPITSYPNWKKDYYICHTAEELKNAYKKISANELLLQQYITKVNELCIDGLVVNHGNDMLVTIASTYTYILPDYYSMEMEIRNFENSDLNKKMQSMFSEIGYEGIFSAEFMIDQNENLWFLEINFRNSTWSYASSKLRMNLPLLWAEGMVKGHISNNEIKPIPEHYIALAEVGDFSQRVRKHKMISVPKWFLGVLKADCRFIWSWRDFKPGFLYWKELVLLVLKRNKKNME